MMSSTFWQSLGRSAAAICAVLIASSSAQAGTYAMNTCGGKKLSGAALACKQVLTAWKAGEKQHERTGAFCQEACFPG
jgi:hypothetical protein